jgi:capsular polysaccharide biosynthesis protein
MWQHAGVTNAKRRKRIFISRRSAGWRHVVNEAEVEAWLASLGFESYDLQDLTFNQQVHLFSEADIVVGTHGAAHTNMLFAPPGATLVEIFAPSYLAAFYWTLSDALACRYWYMVGERAGANTGAGADNLHVPMDRFRNLIGSVLKQPALEYST